MRISESPRISALFLHLIGLGIRVSIGLWSIVQLIVSWGDNSYLRLKERRNPGTEGRGNATLVGARFIQVRSGPVSSMVKAGTGRQGCSGWTVASRHTYSSRVQPKLARSRRPTNEAMDVRKKDWTA